MSAVGALRRIVLAGLCCGAVVGCEVRQYAITLEPDGGARAGGRSGGFNPDFQGNGKVDGSSPDGTGGNRPGVGGGAGGGASCVPEKELCNGADEDCDGVADNGFDLKTDPGNCGSCGAVCVFDHSFPSCVEGKCALQDCLPGYYDTDGNAANGCECLRTNGGVEICDRQDNDCDGQIDEEFDFKADLNNCGACGVICSYANAASSCNAGTCAMGACAAGRLDINQKDNDGCEYSCVPSNGGVEICDGQDNDCDGGLDNNPAGEGAPCGPDVVNVGQCKRGVLTCSSGSMLCLGATVPQIELCDNVDNNCDGGTDEGFNKLGDIRFCGSCKPCALPRAVPRCNVGGCEIEVCSPGWVDLNTTAADGCEYSCTFRGLDICNGADDDCDGQTDEGIDKSSDPTNCGECGNVCTFANAVSQCNGGTCGQGLCLNNFHNNDGMTGNGCEYFCVNTGAEVCDGVDNDCNGGTDEGIDVVNDPRNCGGCGRACSYSNASGLCGASTCSMGACNAGFIDFNNNPTDGCEYACAPSNGGVEICDGVDNDCNKQVDEVDARIGTGCFPSGLSGCDKTAGTCAGTCALGTYACLGGVLACQNAALPGPELCDNLDNDCDGQTDDDFDKQNDPRFCGGCGIACTFTNAVAICQTGTCALGACKNGWVDLDMNPATGCEYACTRDGLELCDGKDNDCDGLTDGTDGSLLYPATNFCLQQGECGKGPGGSARYAQNTFPVCVIPAGATQPDWVCTYPASVQTTGPNQIAGQESWCDTLDNDCDNATDEHITSLGQSCAGTGLGNCPRLGTMRCQTDKDLGAACDLTGSPVPTAAHEICDGKDNDCDGGTDESWNNPGGLGLPTCGGVACLGVRDDIVRASGAGTPFYMFAHEASRPDATLTAQGLTSTRACSRAAVVPWTQVTYTQAQTACRAAGMRLCRSNRTNCTTTAITSDEWGYACKVGLTCANGYFPYGCTYGATTCNGYDFGAGTTVATGSRTLCVTGDLDGNTANIQPAFDMSGNVSEWTEDCRGTLADGTNRKIYTLRGGAYDSEIYGTLTGLRCDFMSLLVAEDFSHPTTGFRCCSDCPAGQAYCGGGCVDLAQSNTHCGTCGAACTGGKTCRNGACL